MAKGTFQHITIVGNLGADPDIRQTASGTSVANLNVGVTTYAGKDQSGQPINHTEWFRCTVWGAQADNAGKYLTKGSKVLITGEIRTRKWQDQNGNDKYTAELHAKDMQFMGGGAQSGGQQSQQPAQQPAQQPQQNNQGFGGGQGAQQTQGQPQSGGNNFDDFGDFEPPF